MSSLFGGKPEAKLEVWKTGSVAERLVAGRWGDPTVQVWTATSPQQLLQAVGRGAADALVLTLEDLYEGGYASILQTAEESQTWVIVMVPKPHPRIKKVDTYRYLVRSGGVRDVIRTLREASDRGPRR